jgi:hypothetical protein
MHRAIVAVGNTILAQAAIMGCAECFASLGVVLLLATVLVVLLEKGRRVRRWRTLAASAPCNCVVVALW